MFSYAYDGPSRRGAYGLPNILDAASDTAERRAKARPVGDPVRKVGVPAPRQTSTFTPGGWYMNPLGGHAIEDVATQAAAKAVLAQPASETRLDNVVASSAWAEFLQAVSSSPLVVRVSKMTPAPPLPDSEIPGFGKDVALITYTTFALLLVFAGIMVVALKMSHGCIVETNAACRSPKAVPWLLAGGLLFFLVAMGAIVGMVNKEG